jgi:hypothetical protein
MTTRDVKILKKTLEMKEGEISSQKTEILKFLRNLESN